MLIILSNLAAMGKIQKNTDLIQSEARGSS